MLFDSLHQKLLPLVMMSRCIRRNGAGSLCGKQMRPERAIHHRQGTRAQLRSASGDEEEFVRLLTAEPPGRPGYFALDAELNQARALTEMQPLAE
jgi:hypothetical protein